LGSDTREIEGSLTNSFDPQLTTYGNTRELSIRLYGFHPYV